MKPDVPVVMRGLFGTMLTEIAPNLTAEYSAGSIGIMSMMIFMTAEEYDRAADIRAAENAEMRALFAEAAGLVDDAGLKAKLAEAAKGRDGSLRVSALDKENSALAALLIELHVHAEESTAPHAAGLEARIWDYLLASVERRKLPFPALG
ncbi:conserved hypothetical protein [Parvibaculum lavamentivorans DS-1]|uniref:Uncharacterized protein n=1 Tax=Parvibaculum lavamentivorans (strain DS-1 / DSM 13023 / NCIMB 13966) TaxID=402881 RepID=A7HW28_PARL1|nr:hypothetical protein [Parvibaculum lavamentivorans]ABS64111.1 conserved hypothetical protein [Parvibaculum lavamentivorans DS-1]